MSFANIFWIAGGKPKPGGFRSLRPALGNVRAGYLIGTAAGEIAADLGDLAPMHQVGTLEAAVRAASAAARARGRRRGRRAPGAGLRLLRPVRQLRGARRRVPRPGPGRGGRAHDLRPPHRPLDRRQLVVDRRPDHAGGRGDPGGDRHGADLRRQPRRRRAGVTAPRCTSSTSIWCSCCRPACCCSACRCWRRWACCAWASGMYGGVRLPAAAHPVLRAGGEGRHALAADLRRAAAAERVRQAGAW